LVKRGLTLPIFLHDVLFIRHRIGFGFKLFLFQSPLFWDFRQIHQAE